jgi:hypothetical protein
MNTTDKIDAARIELLLGELRLPGIKLIWSALAETADKEGWPAARFVAALAEQEMVENEAAVASNVNLKEARLPPGKTLDIRPRCRADDLKGAGRRRRCPARKGRQSPVFWSAAARPTGSRCRSRGSVGGLTSAPGRNNSDLIQFGNESSPGNAPYLSYTHGPRT